MGTYLSAPNVVKWGIPEKFMQKAAVTQSSIDLRSIGPPSQKLKHNQILALISPLRNVYFVQDNFARNQTSSDLP